MNKAKELSEKDYFNNAVCPRCGHGIGEPCCAGDSYNWEFPHQFLISRENTNPSYVYVSIACRWGKDQTYASFMVERDEFQKISNSGAGPMQARNLLWRSLDQGQRIAAWDKWDEADIISQKCLLSFIPDWSSHV